MPGRPLAFTVNAQVESKLEGLITRQRRVAPMILVFPDGRIDGNTQTDSEWANTRSGPFESYVVDIVHNVDSRFATLPYRQDRAIAGLSAGALRSAQRRRAPGGAVRADPGVVGLLHPDAHRRLLARRPVPGLGLSGRRSGIRVRLSSRGGGCARVAKHTQSTAISNSRYANGPISRQSNANTIAFTSLIELASPRRARASRRSGARRANIRSSAAGSARKSSSTPMPTALGSTPKRGFDGPGGSPLSGRARTPR